MAVARTSLPGQWPDMGRPAASRVFLLQVFAPPSAGLLFLELDMFTPTIARVSQFIGRHTSPEELAEKYEADKARHIADAMSDVEAVAAELDDMVFDQDTARLQTDALAFAIAYGRNDDRTIDALNRLDQAIKQRLEAA